MRIFVTGASGYVGSAVVKDMVEAGHEVIGLARSEESVAKVRALGASPFKGDLQDLASLRRGAEQADAVAHLAAHHDFSNMAESARIASAAVAAIGEALAGTGKPFVNTAPTGMIAQGELITEDMQRPEMPGRPLSAEGETRKLFEQGVKAMNVRLPQVNGPKNRAFVPMLIGITREKGSAAYIGDGRNRWPTGHRDDVARLYRLAIEKGQGGRNYHAVAEEGVPMLDILATIAARLGVPLKSIHPEQAAEHYGWFAMFAQMDNPVSSAITRAELGWEPEKPTLLENLRDGDYFDVPSR